MITKKDMDSRSLALADFIDPGKDHPYCYEGYEKECPLDLIVEAVCGFCGCGSPEDFAEWLLVSLEFMNFQHGEMAYNSDIGIELKDWYPEFNARCDKFFGHNGNAMFLYYWLCKEGFTEHGGSVPGWLTLRGDNLLGLLREWKRLSDAEDLEVI